MDAIRDYNPPSEAGTYLKLNDGESAKIRITSLPVIFQNEFKMGDEVTLSTKFAFVIWNHDAGKAQVWETNGATYAQQIKPLLNPVDDDQESDWRKFDIRITRTGEKAQTRYNIKAGTKVYDLDDDQLEAVAAIDIIATLNKSDGKTQVMWLSQWRELEEEAKKKSKTIIKETVDTIKPAKPDVVVEPTEEELGDEPINLDDIPF